MRIPGRLTGVSAIISTLMIIAIAVALSATLFVSATGYLSSLVSGGSNQQPGQNRAQQSLLTIEETHAVAYSNGFPTDGYVLLYVRNVGGVTVTLGSVTVTATPTDRESKSFLSVLSGTAWSVPTSDVYICSEAVSSSSCETTTPPTLCAARPAALTTIGLEQTAKVWIAWCSGAALTPASGDTLQIQVSSTVGTSNVVVVSFP